MPRIAESRITLDPGRYRPVDPVGNGPRATPQPAPPQPYHLVQSTVMISSMPSIASGVDGITRQFYGSGRVPTQRVTLPT